MARDQHNSYSHLRMSGIFLPMHVNFPFQPTNTVAPVPRTAFGRMKSERNNITRKIKNVTTRVARAVEEVLIKV